MTDWTTIDNLLLDPDWYTTTAYRDVFKQLRDEDPVHWTEDESYGKNYWALTRYDDVRNYLLSPTQFSSRWDTRVPRSPKRLTPEERHDQGWDAWLPLLDAPLHAVYRAPINRHFSVPAIARLSDDIAGITEEIIASVADRGEVDLIRDLAAPLPMMAVLRLLGVPKEDWEYLSDASWQTFAAADPRWIIDGDEAATSMYGRQKLLDYGVKLALDRRANPKDDLATIIAQTKIDGDLLSLHELRSWFALIILGGLETTRNAAGVGLWLFIQNQDQRRKLLEDPSTTKGAVEEVLRWVSPAKNRLRIATSDFEFGGKHIRANDWVIGYQASANWDERAFEHPEVFDITRTPNEHISLGAGIHLCLGRALARLEMSTFFQRVLAAFPDLEVVEPDNVEWIADRTVTGFRQMTVRFTPGDARRRESAGSTESTRR